MAYYITTDCICCGACEPECPNQAISEGQSQFVINPERCSECVGAYPSSRCAEVCPVDAPHPDLERRETKEALLAKWQAIHTGQQPAAGTY